ncbi:MAG: hypothetical protein MZW92_36950 [Comamonadaceae bacterium]|nr:hypothetical protein [Comamonadaceae bacterium]
MDQDDPERVLMSKQIAETIARAVGALPEVERDALMAREIEGLSYEQIAERAGCPAATIRTRVFRARERVALHCARSCSLCEGDDRESWRRSAGCSMAKPIRMACPRRADRIAAEGDMREQWTLTAMISDALAGVPWPDDGYSQRILARLDEVAPEPGYDPLAPED